jgi:hypothetical protein
VLLISYSYLNIGGTNANLNSLSSYCSLNISGTNSTLNNKTNFTNLYVSGASTLLSSLNIAGTLTGTTINASTN